MTTFAPSYKEPVAPDRLQAFLDGKLDTNDIVLLMQEVIETQVISVLPPEFLACAVHCVNQGLCTTYGRYLQ